jgi:hypothetical protein
VEAKKALKTVVAKTAHVETSGDEKVGKLSNKKNGEASAALATAGNGNGEKQ